MLQHERDLQVIEQWRVSLEELWECLVDHEYAVLADDSIHGFCGSHPVYAILLSMEHFHAPADVADALVAYCYLSFSEQYNCSVPSWGKHLGLAIRSTLMGKGFVDADYFYEFCDNINTSTKASIIATLNLNLKFRSSNSAINIA